MNRMKTLAVTAIGLAAAGGGIAAGLTATGGSSRAAAAPPAAMASSTAPTIHVATASVGGRTERILVDARSRPLYTYAGDTATASAVHGELAALWPPLTATAPTESGAPGALAVTHDANGSQVRYNGHFLYTFVQDRPGQVTGQGIQDFFVATPGSPAGPAPAPAAASAPGRGPAGPGSSGYYG